MTVAHRVSSSSELEPLPARDRLILVVDDDRDIAEVVQTILLDEGFRVTCLYTPNAEEVKATVEALAPSAVLLDGAASSGYGGSWEIAKWLTQREPVIPTLMLTAHVAEQEEAVRDETDRAKLARVAGIITKPFDVDHLLSTLRLAIGDTPPVLDEREAADLARLLEALRAAGATEVASSRLGRVWATFRLGSDSAPYKVYRWRAADTYFLGKYSETGAQLQPLGQFHTLDGLIAYCVAQSRQQT